MSLPDLTSLSTFSPPPRVILISTTFYRSLSEPRASLAIATARQARLHRIPFLVIDGSPIDAMAAALTQEGAVVLREDEGLMGGKGKGFAYRYGIREALQRASSLFAPSASSSSASPFADFAICISEPEKVDLVRFLPSLTAILIPSIPSSSSPSTPNIVIPHRSPSAFASLPIEQRHSEQFANLHLHNVATSVHPPLTSRHGRIDFLFGPVLFHACLSSYWLRHRSALWDAQIVPYVEAVYAGEGRLLSVEVEYVHPVEQKQEEEGRVEWSGKRFMQLNAVIPALEKAIKAGAENAQIARSPTQPIGKGDKGGSRECADRGSPTQPIVA